MINSLDILDILFAKVESSQLAVLINGTVYKMIRPVGNASEDVVVNCLPVDNDPIQTGVVNINIYVPDLENKVNNIPQHVPNFPRLKELADAAIEALSIETTQFYYYKIVGQSTLKERDINCHFVNLKIEFKFFNL